MRLFFGEEDDELVRVYVSADGGEEESVDSNWQRADDK